MQSIFNKNIMIRISLSSIFIDLNMYLLFKNRKNIKYWFIIFIILSFHYKPCTLLFYCSSVFITFFYVHKKKVFYSQKFSTSGFRWIYIFWDVLKTIIPFLENVCLSICMSPKFCGHCISRTNARILMKLYIQLHLDMI